jgi:hypothetical protein
MMNSSKPWNLWVRVVKGGHQARARNNFVQICIAVELTKNPKEMQNYNSAQKLYYQKDHRHEMKIVM